LHPPALQGREDMHPDRRIGRIIRLRIEHPVAQGVAGVTWTELHQDAGRRGIGGDVGNVGSADRLLHLLDYLPWRRVMGDVEPDPAPPGPVRDVRPTIDGKTAAHQLAVGNDDHFAVTRPDRRLPPAYLRHSAGEIVNPDPVAGAQRVVELQGNTRKHIAKRVLHGKGQHRRDHRRGRQQARRVKADEVQSRQNERCVEQEDADVLGDAHDDDAQPWQNPPKDEHGQQPDQRHSRTDDKQFVDHHCET
jgi:hypothetical protein